jgi:hypothetical protein
MPLSVFGEAERGLPLLANFFAVNLKQFTRQLQDHPGDTRKEILFIAITLSARMSFAHRHRMNCACEAPIWCKLKERHGICALHRHCPGFVFSIIFSLYSLSRCSSCPSSRVPPWNHRGREYDV